MRKRVEGDGAGGGDGAGSGEAAAHGVAFDVVGVVNRKVHFRSRPKALITKAEEAATAGQKKQKVTVGGIASMFAPRA